MYNSERSNITSMLLSVCGNRRNEIALIIPRDDQSESSESAQKTTCGELLDRVAGYAGGLDAAGLRQGDRIAVLTSLSADLFALLLAATSRGVVCVLIDPGMGARRILWAISHAQARAVFSVRTLLSKWPILPAFWGRARFCTDGSFWGCRPLSSLLVTDGLFDNRLSISPDDSALVTFTSGTTGRPKGADRTFGVLTAQHTAIEQELPSRTGDVEMTCFPVVVFHLLTCGMTAVLPPIDLRQPGRADGKRVFEEIQRHGVTRLSGAPAFMERVVEFMESTSAQCPSVKLVYVGGAPVTKGLCRRIMDAFPQADCRVVYGSTEAEPIAGVSMQEILNSPQGEGHLVGSINPFAKVRLVSLPEGRVSLDERGIEPYCVKEGAAGEIAVTGAHVVKSYWNDPKAVFETKLQEPSGVVWHRTGDVGRLDEQGRLWLLGRSSDALRHGNRVLQPFPIEESLGKCDGVARAALVSVKRGGREDIVAVIQPLPEMDETTVEAGIRTVLDCLSLSGISIRFVREIPMDVRHNSKIDRVRLRKTVTK